MCACACVLVLCVVFVLHKIHLNNINTFHEYSLTPITGSKLHCCNKEVGKQARVSTCTIDYKLMTEQSNPCPSTNPTTCKKKHKPYRLLGERSFKWKTVCYTSLWGSVNMLFQNSPNVIPGKSEQCLALGSRRLGEQEKRLVGKGHKGTFKGWGNILCLDSSLDHMILSNIRQYTARMPAPGG